MFRLMKDQKKKRSKYTDEEKAERARTPTINYYKDIERERARERERERERERTKTIILSIITNISFE